MSDLAAYKYGMPAYQSTTGDVSGAANGAVTTHASGVSSMKNVENPALWLLGIGAVTLGLVAFSTHVRVGKFSAGLDAG